MGDVANPIMSSFCKTEKHYKHAVIHDLGFQKL